MEYRGKYSEREQNYRYLRLMLNNYPMVKMNKASFGDLSIAPKQNSRVEIKQRMFYLYISLLTEQYRERKMIYIRKIESEKKNRDTSAIPIQNNLSQKAKNSVNAIVHEWLRENEYKQLCKRRK